MKPVPRKLIIALAAGVVAFLAFFWWQSFQQHPGDIPMGEESQMLETASFVATITAAVIALINLILFVIQMRK